MTPSLSVRNLTPTSIAPGSALSTRFGTADEFQNEQGQTCGTTFTCTPPGGLPLLVRGFSRLAESSTARLIRAAVPTAWAVQEYVQFSRPIAGCQVWPPSTDTSTPATTPPPESVAVPEMTTGEPVLTFAPATSEVIVETG